MNIALADLSQPVDGASHATVSFIRNITHEDRFAKDSVLWLTEERQKRHRERTNSSLCVINYEVGDMIMERI